jgi:hypothetical protein
MGKTKSLAKVKADLQKIVNKYIRLRDAGKPCVSCGQFKELQAGHYYAVSGYDGLRFNEDNIHGECSGCNCFNESHLIPYTLNIANRITEHGLEELHHQAAEYKREGYRWTRMELDELKEYYKKKIENLHTSK